jgi:hypothetical protein
MSRRRRGAQLHRWLEAARRSPWLIVLAGVGIIAAITLTVLGILDRQQADEATEDKEATQVVLEQTDAEKRTLAAQILAECQTGDLAGRICDDAGDATRAPTPQAPAPPPVESVLTPAEVERVVADWLLEHPPPAGRPPTADEVAAAVAEYLIANPPEPGRGPTPDEVAGAVDLWFADNPPPQPEQGDRGEKGDKGDPPTPDEVRAAVDAWFADNPPQPGPPGPACPDGTTLRQVTYGDGLVGVGCVFDEQPTPTTTPTPDPPVIPTDVLPG